MKIYTKTGDTGKTSLFGGSRVDKNDARVEGYGSIDELNSWIGLLRDQKIPKNPSLKIENETLKRIQETLFVIGSHLASDDDAPQKFLPELDFREIEKLEQEIDRMEAELKPLKHFILPGGHTSVSFVHITRNVCRRAERLVVSFKDLLQEKPFILTYLNRLSDYLFVLSRYWTYIMDVEEYKWIPNPK